MQYIKLTHMLLATYLHTAAYNVTDLYLVFCEHKFGEAFTVANAFWKIC